MARFLSDLKDLSQSFAQRLSQSVSLRTHVTALAAGWVLLVALAGGLVVFLADAEPASGATSGASPFRLQWVLAAVVSGSAGFFATFALATRLLRPVRQMRREMQQVVAGQLPAPRTGESAVCGRDLRELSETFDALLQNLHKAAAEHGRSQQALAARTKTVDRLLDFTLTIQGAGKPEQVFSTLGHFLQTELSLSSLVVLSHEPDAVPAVQVKACWPEDLAPPERPVADLDTALCPCLRQNQPRVFKPEGSPVRCALEQCLKLPATHPAYCVPFNVGTRTRLVIHMLLPPWAEGWTEERRQLAQAYVNTAQSALNALHLLAEAEKQSMTDGLTGLYNRRSLEQLLEREVALAERHSKALSLVMIDMDRFKQINDTHGHAAGDHLLKSFAECVRMTLRKTDLAFRYGGDEFVIALPQTGVAQAQQVVQKLRQAFAAVDFSDAVAQMEHAPTLSIGLAERSAAHNVLSLAALLSAADQALYEAKSGDRNCIKVYQPPQAA